MNVRAIAARTLGKVLDKGCSLNTILPLALNRTLPRDHGLLQEICYGVCRWYLQLQALLDKLLVKPLVTGEYTIRALLLAGLYQLWHTRIPEHAAVAETATAARQLQKPWAVGLVNAILRSASRRRMELTEYLSTDLEANTSHPWWLLKRLQQDWPYDWSNIITANNKLPPLTIRINLSYINRKNYQLKLEQAGQIVTPVPDLAAALNLAELQNASMLPSFKEGLISVQDVAAQLAVPLLDLQPGQRVLDACAAPGGKTGHILELEPNIYLTALDRDPKRLEQVRDNLKRLLMTACVVHGDACRPADWWDGIPYDRILVDAPCSGTGVIRRHPDIKLLRRDQDITVLAEKQLMILSNLWPLLRIGGRLLYVTCSVLRQENEQVINSFLAGHQDAREYSIDAKWGRDLSHGRQLLPGETNTDGFYYAVLHKNTTISGV
jgi:16S rRNA (cytosine967-C5)-methyltransferase